MEQTMDSRRRHHLLLLAGIGLAGLYILYALIVNYSADDGYIAFQYVKNLVNGYGPVYNPGERVEGYNNFLWIISLAGLKLLLPQAEIPAIARTLGILSGALTIVGVVWFSRDLHPERPVLSLLAGAFLALHSGFIAWSTAGLETTQFAFFLFLAAWAYLHYLSTGKHFWLVPVLFVVLSLTRTDGLLFFGLTLAHFALWGLRRLDLAALVKRLAAWVLIFGVLYGVYFAWRYSYYGYLLPNVFYAKIGGGMLQYLRGARYLWHYAGSYGLWVFLLPLAVLLRRKRETWIDYVALLVAVYCVYIVYAGGDGLAFFRFLVYIAPLIYLLVQEGIAALADIFARRAAFQSRLAGLALAGLASVSLLATTRQTGLPLVRPDSHRWTDPQTNLVFPGLDGNNPYNWYDNYFVDRLAVAARWLDTYAPENALVASTPAGSIAYHMRQPVIDMLGLNDLHIARAPAENIGSGRAGHERGDGQYVLQRNPEFILMGNVAVYPQPLDEQGVARVLTLKSEHQIWNSEQFHERYTLVCAQVNDHGVLQYFSFYMRKDVTLSEPARKYLVNCSTQLGKAGE